MGQQLVWQGSILSNEQIIGELDLSSSQVVVMQLAVQIIPDDADITRARHLLKETHVVLDQLDRSSIRELEVCVDPPLAVEVICIGVLHLVAGISPKIDTRANGAPKDPSWKTCQRMLS